MEFLVSVLFFLAMLASSLTVLNIFTLLIKSYWIKGSENESELNFGFLLVLFIITDVFWALFFHFI